MSKELFKIFAKSHPELASKVLSRNVSWQQLYELYEIYGEDNSIWNNYLDSTGNSSDINNNSIKEQTSFKDLFNTFKNLDMESVQQGVSNLQKTIGLLQDLGLGAAKNISSNTYEPRPIYQHFDD